GLNCVNVELGPELQQMPKPISNKSFYQRLGVDDDLEAASIAQPLQVSCMAGIIQVESVQVDNNWKPNEALHTQPGRINRSQTGIYHQDHLVRPDLLGQTNCVTV